MEGGVTEPKSPSGESPSRQPVAVQIAAASLPGAASSRTHAHTHEPRLPASTTAGGVNVRGAGMYANILNEA